MTMAERAPAGWGSAGNDVRRDAAVVGREPDLFIASNSNERTTVEFLNKTIVDAVRNGASDIHFENHEGCMLVRYRLNGELEDIAQVDAFMGRLLEMKLREKARLTVSERNVALDSRMSFRVDDRPVDMRVSVLPTRMGMSVVCRILDQNGANRRLADVWMSPAVRAEFEAVLGKPDGIFLMTGPTGSGKTSTLYAALNEVNTRNRKILTIEDPVEYRLKGACQVEVSRDLTFAGALRASLRQDPDVILVGEIRDAETAVTAMQAAMTGHLVFTTLHANNAPSTLTRLTDLGIDPFTLGAAIQGVVAQRLAPLLCDHCKKMVPLSSYEKAWVEKAGHDPEALYAEKVGCEQCGGRGIKGRVPVIEMLVRSDEIRYAIEAKSVTEIEAAARLQPQFETLEQCSIRMAKEGLIPLSAAKYIGGA